MKKYLLVSLLAFVSVSASAKKVKFAVDMGSDTINTTGMHITGDFQLIAGYQSDWCSDCTPLTQEGSTSIYSIIVDIPAFTKYEYKFLNGDQFYNAEFVPVQSRVGYSFNDNRWLYVDSIANDTTFVGAIRYAANAPAGLNLVRFYVDMSLQTVSGNGVHVAGSNQAWNTKKDILYHFVDAAAGIYEVISYVAPNSYQYKFYNGNTSGNAETVPSNCAVSGNRSVTVSSDTLLAEVCYSACVTCAFVGMQETNQQDALSLYPNPSTAAATVVFKNNSAQAVVITDVSGKAVRFYEKPAAVKLLIEREGLPAGMYFVNVRYSDNSMSKAKLIFQ